MSVLVLIEHDNKNVKGSSLNTITAAKKIKVEEKQKIKKTLKKVESKEKKITGNIEKKGVKKKPLTTKKK